MFQNKKVENIIIKRTSIRNYSEKELDNSTIQQIRNIINQKIKTPFGSNPRFELINKKEFSGKVKLGTYGFISGAQYFIVGATVKNNNYLEDYGYALEQIILQLCDLEIGTCWLGGTFSRDNFAKTINLAENEIIPAITPVGIAADKRSVKEKVIRALANAKNRKRSEDLFFLNDFETSLNKNAKPEYLKALEMIRLAPSAENFQPWRVILTTDNIFHFFLQRKKIIKEAFSIDLQKIDLGIALCHFELYLQSIRHSTNWFTDDKTKIASFENKEYIISAKIQNL